MMRVDARGLLCPLPVLRLRKALERLAPGERLALLTSDPMAVVDVPHFCGQAGHVMVQSRPIGDGAHEFIVAKGPLAARTAPSLAPANG